MQRTTYLVCASPRTGSTLLCEGLRDVFEAGTPAEYFDNRPHVDARYKARLHVDNDAAYFDAVLRETTTGNGVCGLKVHWHQRLTMERIIRAAWQRAATERPDLTLAEFQTEQFGPVKRIWLRRRDHVAQAISLYRASRSDIWHVPSGKAAPSELDQLAYNFADIDYLVHSSFRYDTSWGKYFTEHGLSAFVVFYEDLVADHHGTMSRVLDYLGMPQAKPLIAPPALSRLAGRTSRDWMDRYRKDKLAWIESADLVAA